MDIIELFIDDNDDNSGIEAISVVESPAIQEDFIALKNQEFKLAEVDKEKRILMGAALVPNKPIYRKSGDNEYYIYFSKNTVKKASELFLAKGNQNNSTLEHQVPLQGLSVVESWIVEGDKDKSRHYDLNVPIGTWMVSMKVYNDDVWNDYVKTGKVKGFSIEGYFADKLERPKESIKDNFAEKVIDGHTAYDTAEQAYAVAKSKGCEGIHTHDVGGKTWYMPCKTHQELEAEDILAELTDMLSSTKLESYTDYPNAVKNNAKRGIELNEKVGNKCATQVGKVRATQLAQGKPITVETIKRMFSYLSRAGEYYDESDTEACGTISYLLWGGKAALRWSGAKLKELDLLEASLKEPCQAGYEMIGFKMKDGKRVPNCVPLSENLSSNKVDLNAQDLQNRLNKAISQYEKALKQIKITAANSFKKSKEQFLKLSKEFNEYAKKANDLGLKDAENEFKRLAKICDNYYLDSDINEEGAKDFK